MSSVFIACSSSEQTKSETKKENEVEVIKLNQTPGKFTNGDLKLSPGTYKFEVINDGVDHEVGLVLAPKKAKITKDDHIQEAYVVKTVADGESQSSKGEITLGKGKYVYFCPLNPTPEYTIMVE